MDVNWCLQIGRNKALIQRVTYFSRALRLSAEVSLVFVSSQWKDILNIYFQLACLLSAFTCYTRAFHVFYFLGVGGQGEMEVYNIVQAYHTFLNANANKNACACTKFISLYM